MKSHHGTFFSLLQTLHDSNVRLFLVRSKKRLGLLQDILVEQSDVNANYEKKSQKSQNVAYVTFSNIEAHIFMQRTHDVSRTVSHEFH